MAKVVLRRTPSLRILRFIFDLILLKPLTQVPDNILVNMLLQRVVKVFGLPMSHEAFDAETLSFNIEEVALVYEFPIDNVE